MVVAAAASLSAGTGMTNTRMSSTRQKVMRQLATGSSGSGACRRRAMVLRPVCIGGWPVLYPRPLSTRRRPPRLWPLRGGAARGRAQTHISRLPRPTTHSHGTPPALRHRETSAVPSVLADGERPKSWARRAGGRSSSATARGEPALALRDARKGGGGVGRGL